MCRQRVPSRESGKRRAQNRSSSSSSYNWRANQHAPHCRGRCNCMRSSRTCTPWPCAWSGTARSAANSASCRWRPASSSNASITRHQASCWLSLISPRYSTWRCITFPVTQRRFSTIFQYRCSLPSLKRLLKRKNMMRIKLRHLQMAQKVLGLHYRDSPSGPLVPTRMTPDQIAEAQRLASEWKPK